MACKGFGGEVIGFFLAVAFCITCPEYVSSAQRELGKGVANTSATAPPAGTVDNAIRTGPAVADPRPTPRTGPYFDIAGSKNVTALLGKTAYLNCRVKNLGNKTLNMQVSWVRHRDIHLLTVGRYTYTSDQRFRAIHLPHTEDWTLQIKYPQHRDSGIYECQISTTPHMSHFIHLNVVEPTTEIIGGPDLYIDRGSTINLTCVVLYSPEPPAYIFWNHNDAIISYDSPRGGVSVVTEKGETTTSFLLIQQARPSDSGTYQCNPSNAQSKSIVVHVLNGEYPAAMQRGGQAFAPTSATHCLVLIIGLLVALS
ncbi:neurotrimin-like isoform X3 [Epargyreus clarus]|uniref:neurotrimin-like isoform X3 n=1 Tax=Epargyreus clarus TaxID=520877 RepID=UPI003C2F67DD